MKPADRPAWLFAALCAVAALGLGAYYAWIRATRFAPGADVVTGALPQLPAAPSGTARPDLRPLTAAGRARGPGRRSVSRPDATGPPDPQDPLPAQRARRPLREARADRLPGSRPASLRREPACEAVHFAAGRGICLSADRGVFTTYAAEILDARFAPLLTLPAQGGPSRCRVSGTARSRR